jgi:uncharacterized protein YjiS (DUF1127 family)
MLYQHRKTTSARRVADRLWHAFAFTLKTVWQRHLNARSLDNLGAVDLKDLGLRRRPDGGYWHRDL